MDSKNYVPAKIFLYYPKDRILQKAPWILKILKIDGAVSMQCLRESIALSRFSSSKCKKRENSFASN